MRVKENLHSLFIVNSVMLGEIMLVCLQIIQMLFHLQQFYFYFSCNGQNFFAISYGLKQILLALLFLCLLLLVFQQFFFIFLNLIFILLSHQLFSFSPHHLCVFFLREPLNIMLVLQARLDFFNLYSFYFLLVNNNGGRRAYNISSLSEPNIFWKSFRRMQFN